MNLPRLIYISQNTAQLSHLQSITRACEAGCKFIQLRIKNESVETVRQIAIEAQKICKAHQAMLFINDFVEIAKEIRADGIHVGKNDMPPSLVRKEVGSNMIIGGTANTFEDIQQLANSQVDYIGLGPFRFTVTKKNLSPVLGINGYESLMQQCKNAGITIPIYAIGGIQTTDVEVIMETGVYGIAVSSALTKNQDIKKTVSEFNQYLYPIPK